MNDHAREVASALGLRAPTNSDLPDVIEAAAQAAWTTDRGLPSSPKPDHVRDVIDKLRFVRNIGIEADAAGRIHETRFRQFTREGLASPTYLIERYAPHRRRATVAAL